MTIAIMQPYFLPYIGYFQLINSVDSFVIYDNIKYTKKGWINRNRMLVNGKDEYFSVPLQKDSDFLNVVERQLAEIFLQENQKTLRKIKEVYKKAPQISNVLEVVESIFNNNERNLFNFIFHSIKQINEYLDIQTKLIISSTIPVDHQLKGADKVMAICKSLNAGKYINPVGGQELYDKTIFGKENLELKFLLSKPFEYMQFGNTFVPWLSILDVIMFNDRDTIKDYLNNAYQLI
ncbi:MAG: WbqC family protein [Ferruginibacter sp.]